MIEGYRGGNTPQHQEISALIPWLVNSRISEGDRERVDEHLRDCAMCRDDFAHEQRVYRGMTAGTAVEYMPAASLKRLQARLDNVDKPAAETAPQPLRKPLPWMGVMAASAAIMALALSLLAAERWRQFPGREASNYYTVTTPASRAPGEVIRAVFSPSVTLVELQAILEESQLKIVAGPTEAGVYSLAAISNRPVGGSLALLRHHSAVRFAESTQSSAVPGDSR